MKPTNIFDSNYFHKVVDCQFACPGHTPVPEYIRLKAQERYTEAYTLTWDSNVFPGVLGRTCDRPCEPACRRLRTKEKAVAICRLKRAAADNKGDADYDPYDRIGALNYVQKMHEAGHVATGLLYVDPDAVECRDILETTATSLNELSEEALCPGSKALRQLIRAIDKTFRGWQGQIFSFNRFSDLCGTCMWDHFLHGDKLARRRHEPRVQG